MDILIGFASAGLTAFTDALLLGFDLRGISERRVAAWIRARRREHADPNLFTSPR